MRLLAFVGSLRPDSTNLLLMEQLRSYLPDGVEVELYGELKGLPAYDPADDEGQAPAVVQRLREQAAKADGFLFATPEYNASIPGTLKNALDWLSRPFASNPLRSKPALVVGASTGMFGAAWATEDLKRILRTIGARALEKGFTLPQAHEAFDKEGRLLDPEQREQLEGLSLLLFKAVREEQEFRTEGRKPVAV